MRKSARLAYCILFTLAMVLAWILRDFAKPIIDKLPCESSSLLVFLLSRNFVPSQSLDLRARAWTYVSMSYRYLPQ